VHPALPPRQQSTPAKWSERALRKLLPPDASQAVTCRISLGVSWYRALRRVDRERACNETATAGWHPRAQWRKLCSSQSRPSEGFVMARNGTSAATQSSQALQPAELQAIDAYWRARNYLAAGMIYLQHNPLLREPLRPEHIKNRLLGHWGASPGLSFTYVHLNRLINKYDLDAIFLAGPGHGAPGVLDPVHLEGTYSEVYPNKGEDVEGMRVFFREFSFPGGIGSHCTPETREVHGRAVEGYGARTRCRSPTPPSIPRASRCSSNGCAAIGRMSCSMETAG
jgi:hypothetical protein